ncbi:phosphosulfolactate synthase [Alicyclobacillus acidiphilus]|uniref:phosphosulfolactate synthase n=1 Tax=Alicyclobacillus acidiphilus TaxID=182455 RepID=UPI0009FB6C66|nr:phosphosulfolactate synthase [Alicyclobacillus acidiphilus]
MILSDRGPFSQILKAPIGGRPEKPRKTGFTMVIDKGLGFYELRDVLEVASSYIDVVKFGFGTSPMYPEHILRRKLCLLEDMAVSVMPGGTLAEIAYTQDVFEAYVRLCRKLGFNAVEISDGTIELAADERRRLIAHAKAEMPLVISEVGKKLQGDVDIVAYARGVLADLDAGADYVVVEGRESGEGVGVFDASGTVQDDLVDTFLVELPTWAQEKVIWEAPKKAQQVAFIQRIGPTVNLGNIPPSDVIALECLRQGFRADTFTLTLPEHPHHSPEGK